MLKTKIITVIIISIFAALSVSANSGEQRVVNIALKGLSQKLKSDLAMTTINLKLDQVSNQNVSAEKTVVSGFGTVQNAKDIALTFNVAVNPAKNDIVEINYDIVSPVAIEPAAATENFLMKKVMGKMKSDYATEEIVMAIDSFETVKSIDGKTNYVGVAEVRVGMEWSRIEFDVQGNAKTGATTDIKYKVVE